MRISRKLLIYLTITILTILNFLNIQACHAKIHIPKPVGYVNDFANVISDSEEPKLNSIIQELKAKTGAEVVVVTLNSLEGYPVEDVSLEIGREWKVGQVGKNNGLIVLVVPNDRKMRIEVGYGLEGYLTDAQAGRIRDDYMIPYFKQGNYSYGIIAGTAAVIDKLAKGYGIQISGNYSIPQPTQNDSLPIPAIVLFLIIIVLSRGRIFLFIPGWGYGGDNSFGGDFGSGFGGFSGGGGFGGGGASGGW